MICSVKVLNSNSKQQRDRARASGEVQTVNTCIYMATNLHMQKVEESISKDGSRGI